MRTIAITATFTAEPIEESLTFWLRKLEIAANVVFAPYSQVFQQLLDPASLLSTNQDGINIILVRFEDWLRAADATEAGPGVTPAFSSHTFEKIERNVQDLVLALKSAVERSKTPHLVCLCPASHAAAADAHCMAFFKQMEERMVTALDGISSVSVLTTAELDAAYPVPTPYDPQGDELGHIPFTPLWFTALGTLIARKLHTIWSAPYKVIVLDCDQTLWQGVCGEDGALGINFDPPRKALQEFMVRQHDVGMLLCLCSKNNEEDVLEVFARRPEMPLTLDHIVSWRLNWQPKSANIQALAEELQLGLDSFIFLDDNPIECAEVQAHCPQVLTLQLPQEPERIPRFLHHVWAFDRQRVTEEDKKRSLLYRQNAQRERFRHRSLSLEEFLAGLNLEVQIAALALHQLARVAQLTQRTNQFNVSTRRRSEGEIRHLCQSGERECLVVEVSDRFGAYGLVGVIMFGVDADAVAVDTFLLSCRAMGRGVEHRMLAELGTIAAERGLAWVDVHYIPSAKNQPAADFLKAVGARFQQPHENGLRFRFPCAFATALAYKPGEADIPSASEAADPLPTAGPASKSALMTEIAIELYDAEHVLDAIACQNRRTRPELGVTFVAPRDTLELQLSKIWEDVLRLQPIGVQDDFFELGGHSLLAVQLFAQIEKLTGKRLPLATLFHASTVEHLTQLLRQDDWVAPWASLVPIQTGGSQPPFFCLHGAGGNVLSYRDLARCLGPDQPFYGLQAQGLDGSQPLLTSVEDMASHYLAEVRAFQPKGPYFLGGLCFGGLVAFEIAQQLWAQGEQVALLALLDTYGPGYPQLLPTASHWRYRLDRWLIRLKAHQGNLRLLGPREKLTYMEGRVRRHLTPYVARLAQQCIRLGRRFSAGLGLQPPTNTILQQIEAVNLEATKRYIPQVYPGRLTLFRAGKQPPGCYPDPYQGWGGLATEGIDAYEIEGDHFSMLQEPLVHNLAAQLRTCLHQAQEAASAPQA